MKKKLVALLLSGAMVTGLFTCTVVVNAETNTAAEEEEAEESGSVLDEIFSEDGLIGRLTGGKAGVILKSAAEELTKSDSEISPEIKEAIRVLSSQDIGLAKKLSILVKTANENDNKVKKALGDMLSELLNEDGSLDLEKAKNLTAAILGENGVAELENKTELVKALGSVLGIDFTDTQTDGQSIDDMTEEEFAEWFNEFLGEDVIDETAEAYDEEAGVGTDFADIGVDEIAGEAEDEIAVDVEDDFAADFEDDFAADVTDEFAADMEDSFADDAADEFAADMEDTFADDAADEFAADFEDPLAGESAGEFAGTFDDKLNIAIPSPAGYAIREYILDENKENFSPSDVQITYCVPAKVMDGDSEDTIKVLGALWQCNYDIDETGTMKFMSGGQSVELLTLQYDETGETCEVTESKIAAEGEAQQADVEAFCAEMGITPEEFYNTALNQEASKKALYGEILKFAAENNEVQAFEDGGELVTMEKALIEVLR